ncbi:MAG: 6-bladed beta-propeller [Candidatus Aminicenantes bacterium]|nr:6-bladed beta-propeller [Candidatus Aminicenantes bacterium]
MSLNMKSRIRAFGIGILFSAISFVAIAPLETTVSAEQKLQWKGTVTKEGDVTVVKNPKEPLYKENILNLKQDFSLGGPEAEVSYAFSNIRTFTVDEAQNIYVLDDKEACIKVFDDHGKYLRTFGRKGQGPGELNLPSSISINKTKKELIVQEVSRRLSIFSLDGKFLRNLSLRDVWGLRVRQDALGNIYVQEAVLDPQDPRYLLKKFDPSMKFLAVLATTPAPKPSAFNPFMAVAYWNIDESNNIIYGYPKDYEIQIFSPESKLIKRIMRRYDPVEITEEEKKEQIKDIPQGRGITLEFSKNHPAFSRFFLDDQGRIFVQSWESGASAHQYYFDMFDADGRYIAKVLLKQHPVVLKKDKLYSLEEDEDGYQLVKRYSVTWSVK